MTKFRRFSKAVTPLACVFFIAGIAAPQEALGFEFQTHAAINDSKAEVVDTQGWSKTIFLPADKQAGTTINLLNGQKYRLQISGTFVYAKGNDATGKPARFADAECAIDPVGDLRTGNQWQSERFKGWGSDLLDVLVTNGASAVPFNWIAADPYAPLSPGGEMICSRTNTYYADIVASAWSLTFKIDDRYWYDNLGELKITVSRAAFSANRSYEGRSYQCPKWTEEDAVPEPGAKIGGIAHAGLMLDSRRNAGEIPKPGEKDLLGNRKHSFNSETGHWGMYTCNWGLPDTTYRIVADGVWKYNSDQGQLALADTECATGSAEYEADLGATRTPDETIDKWMDRRYVDNKGTATRSDDIDYLDLWINEDTDMDLDWTPMFPDPNNPKCAGDADHTYYIDITPDRTGPLRFSLGDWDYYEQNNRGMICIHIERVGLAGGHQEAEAEQAHDISNVADFITG